MVSAQDRQRHSFWLLTGLAAVYFLMEFVPNVIDGYGYFIDELYYIACSKRLAFWYVDHPPLSMVVLAAWRSLFGIGFAVWLPGLVRYSSPSEASSGR